MLELQSSRGGLHILAATTNDHNNRIDHLGLRNTGAPNFSHYDYTFDMAPVILGLNIVMVTNLFSWPMLASGMLPPLPSPIFLGSLLFNFVVCFTL
jgi:hypothetical protein